MTLDNTFYSIWETCAHKFTLHCLIVNLRFDVRLFIDHRKQVYLVWANSFLQDELNKDLDIRQTIKTLEHSKRDEKGLMERERKRETNEAHISTIALISFRNKNKFKNYNESNLNAYYQLFGPTGV